LNYVRPIIVIGIGNTLRQDDGLGPAVVERLRERVNDSRVELLDAQTLTPELTAEIWKARRVIFIDASEALAAGEIQHRSVERDEEADVSLVHFLSPEALLVWTGRLYGCVPLAEIWLMGVEQVGLSETLTPTVAGKLEVLVELVHERIRQELTGE
jgi:hydrogenase maturation protease